MPIDFTKIEEQLHLESGSLEKLNSSEDNQTLDLSHLKVFKNDDYELLQANTIKEHQEALEEKQRYSRIASSEEDTKFYKKELGLDFAGKKREDFAQALKAKMLEQNGGDNKEELLSLQEKINSYKEGIDGENGFKYQLEQKELEYQKLKESIQQEKDSFEINSLLDSEISKYSDKINLSVEDFKAIYKTRFNRNLQKGDSGVNIFEGDQLLKGQFKENLSLELDIKNLITPYLKKPEGGKAGEETNSNGKMNTDQFTKAFFASNPNASNIEFTKALNTAVMAGDVE